MYSKGNKKKSYSYFLLTLLIYAEDKHLGYHKTVAESKMFWSIMSPQHTAH